MRTIQRVLVTGATGMIGAHTTRKLLKENIEVVALVRPASKKMKNLPVGDPRLTIVEAELSDIGARFLESDAQVACEDAPQTSGARTACEDVLPPVDAVIHFGWAATFGADRNNAALQEKNVEDSLQVLRLAKKLGAKVFIGAGSQAEYGPCEGILRENTPCHPETEYGKAKGKVREEGRKLAKALGIDFLWTRILSVYGPFDNSYTMVMSALSTFLKGEHFSCTNGDQIWDYLYAEDAAECFVRLLKDGKDGRTYVLGGGSTKTLHDYIELIRDEANPNLPIGFGERPYNDHQVMHLEADISALKEDTGYVPETTFEEGIKKTAEWLKKEETK